MPEPEFAEITIRAYADNSRTEAVFSVAGEERTRTVVLTPTQTGLLGKLLADVIIGDLLGQVN
jgi:O-succinylbenzoate synthase